MLIEAWPGSEAGAALADSSAATGTPRSTAPLPNLKAIVLDAGPFSPPFTSQTDTLAAFRKVRVHVIHFCVIPSVMSVRIGQGIKRSIFWGTCDTWSQA